MRNCERKDGLEKVDSEGNEEESEDVNILDSRTRSRGSIFSKYSAWSFRTYNRSYQMTFVIISVLAIFITGMTLGSITVRFFLCDAEKPRHLNMNLSYPLSHLYDSIWWAVEGKGNMTFLECIFSKQSINEWINEWLNEWMIEWMNKWMNG